MSKHPIHIVSLFIVVIVAAQTAIAAPPITVYLAERSLPVEPGDPTLSGPPPTTTTTTTTTTTLPIVPRCPDSIAGGQAGSRDGDSYSAFSWDDICAGGKDGGVSTIYCFLNPRVDPEFPDLSEQPVMGTYDWYYKCVHGVLLDADGTTKPCGGWKYAVDWQKFVSVITGLGSYHSNACFICGCLREIGCFPPGVKITMADGSLRNIEDVRAGDMVRNAKTSAPVKVGKVIEGPEALPLIRFGFDGATVTTSQAHPVLTAAGLKPANQLKKGDTVFDAQGNPHPVTILETLPIEEGQRVINVDLEAASSDANERLLISDGIITGDIVLQGLLKAQK